MPASLVSMIRRDRVSPEAHIAVVGIHHWDKSLCAPYKHSSCLIYCRDKIALLSKMNTHELTRI